MHINATIKSQGISFVWTIVLLTVLLTLNVLGDSYGDDDSGEISVPRRPQILGPSKVEMTYYEGDKLEDLICLVESSPTASIVWLKNGQRVTAEEANIEFDGKEGKASLEFKEEIAGKKSEGNYSCVAGNFRGRDSKIFSIYVLPNPTTTTSEEPISTSSATASTTSKNSTSTGNKEGAASQIINSGNNLII